MLIAIAAGIGILFATGLLGLTASRWRAAGTFVYGVCALVSLLHLGIAGIRLMDTADPAPTLVLPFGLPWFEAHFRLDALAAYFLVVANLIGGAVSLFAIGYGRHEAEPARVLPLYPWFLAGMTLVVLADDAFVFLLSWEFMSLTSWLLVLSTHREKETSHAAYVYLVMAAAGTMALLLAFGLLAGLAGDYSFASMREGERSPLLGSLVILLVLLGAGSKAGLVPLHAWLPLAHPAAPSHVSALMSGVMTKVAVYGLVRVLFDLVGGVPWWWGAILLAIGAVSAVIGVLYALMQHDLKKLLAYHTVENIGIIVTGLGLSLIFQASGFLSYAALAFVAALFHVLNHALFKSLLFCGAGAVLTATGERDMETLGGLIRRMPVTAFTFLVGAAAISALPPLNGFVSEWLTFQAILQSPNLPQWPLKFGVPIAGALLALAAALAAACFVKAFGITFLGRARSAKAGDAREVEPVMLAAMIGLAALCFLFGVLPSAAVALLRPAADLLIGGDLSPAFSGFGWIWVAPVGIGRGSYSGTIVLAVITAVTILVVWLIHRFASDRVRRAPAWDCGYPDPRPETQYTAGSFAQPLRRVFGTTVFQARETVEMPAPGQLEPARLTVVLRDLAWDWFYQPIGNVIGRSAEQINQLQFLTIRRYLTLMFLALAALLTIVAVSQ